MTHPDARRSNAIHLSGTSARAVDVDLEQCRVVVLEPGLGRLLAMPSRSAGDESEALYLGVKVNSIVTENGIALPLASRAGSKIQCFNASSACGLNR